MKSRYPCTRFISYRNRYILSHLIGFPLPTALFAGPNAQEVRSLQEESHETGDVGFIGASHGNSTPQVSCFMHSVSPSFDVAMPIRGYDNRLPAHAKRFKVGLRPCVKVGLRPPSRA